MTHIDTYSHRIPHKLTQLHTNTHILHTFTHKLPHLWVGHKKSHVYIYIYIYIQQNHTFHTYIHSFNSTPSLSITNETKTTSIINRKKIHQSKNKTNSNQFIHS